jgi:Nif-specific regulatory protein
VFCNWANLNASAATATIKIDVRLVAATNRNLEESVAKGDFRSDLYYRISVVPIFIPPLRDRKGDIPLLAREFLDRFNAENEANLSLTENAMEVLTSCYFPGNVRELENCIRRTATLANSDRLVSGDFACRNDECLSAVLWKRPADSNDGFVAVADRTRRLVWQIGRDRRAPCRRGRRRSDEHSRSGRVSAVPNRRTRYTRPAGLMSRQVSFRARRTCYPDDPQNERDRLVEAMETAGWVQAKAARILGLTPRQIGYALRKHEIPVKKF